MEVGGCDLFISECICGNAPISRSRFTVLLKINRLEYFDETVQMN